MTTDDLSRDARANAVRERAARVCLRLRVRVSVQVFDETGILSKLSSPLRNEILQVRPVERTVWRRRGVGARPTTADGLGAPDPLLESPSPSSTADRPGVLQFNSRELLTICPLLRNTPHAIFRAMSHHFESSVHSAGEPVLEEGDEPLSDDKDPGMYFIQVM